MSRYLDRIAGRPLTGTTPAPEPKPAPAPKPAPKPAPAPAPKPAPAPAPVVKVEEGGEGWGPILKPSTGGLLTPFFLV